MSTAMEMLERVIGGEDALEVIRCVKAGTNAEGEKGKEEDSSSLRERAERFLRLERRREGE